MKTITLTAPVYWASYLVNGDASGLNEVEKQHADHFLAANKVRVLDVARDEDGEGKEPRFTWNYDLFDTLADVRGGEVIDYICVEEG